jgi:hypothetical protein
MVNKENGSSPSINGRSLASGSDPQGLQLAASAMPVAATSATQQASPSDARKAKEIKASPAKLVQRRQMAVGRVLALLMAPLHWPMRLLTAIWAWIASLTGRRPAAA